MDALTFLRGEHESVLGMIESLERGRGNREAELQARDHLATSLVIAASQHDAVEEQFFWPAVRRALPDGDELADRALAEEDSAKQLLQRIDDSEVGTPSSPGAQKTAGLVAAVLDKARDVVTGRRSHRPPDPPAP
ncbi:hemerythrin domain-containing protein [Nocardia xishanensis]